MPLDDEKVKAALDDFEADKFLDAKDKLSAEIARARDEFLQKTLELKGEINPDPEDDEIKDDEIKDDDDDDEIKDDDDDDEDDEEKQKRKERVKARLAAKKKEEDEE